MNLPFKLDPKVDIHCIDQNYLGSNWIRPDHPDYQALPNKPQDPRFRELAVHGHTWATLISAGVRSHLHSLNEKTPDLMIIRDGVPSSFHIRWGIADYTKVPTLRVVIAMSLYAASPDNEFKILARNKRLSELGFGAPDDFFFALRDRVRTSQNFLSVRQSQLAMSYTLHLALRESFAHQMANKQNIPPEDLVILAFPFLVHGVFCNISLEDILLGEIPGNFTNQKSRSSISKNLNSLSIAKGLLNRVGRENLNSDQRSLFDFCMEMLEVGPMNKLRRSDENFSPSPYPDGLAGGISDALPGGGNW